MYGFSAGDAAARAIDGEDDRPDVVVISQFADAFG
jgi:hypothetical protein